MFATSSIVKAVCLVLLVGAVCGTRGSESNDDNFDLPSQGILLEGIGLDRAQEGGVIYVSGVNDGGNIYRGRVGGGQLQQWFDGEGTTGRGIDVDDLGRVFVAGGPTGTVRIFDRSANLLATLSVKGEEADSFLNDVYVGSDGAYVTDSSRPFLWRVYYEDSTQAWAIEKWLDLSPSITYTPPLTDFDVGGIAITPNGKYIIVSQGTTGQLWRIHKASKEITEVDLGGNTILGADGIVLKGNKLWVVQNFVRQVSEYRLRDEYTKAEQREVVATPQDRFLTTAVRVNGDLLVVDSQFGFAAATAPAQDRVIVVDL